MEEAGRLDALLPPPPPPPRRRPLPPEGERPRWLMNRPAFDAEVAKHARLGRWRKLAETFEAACEMAPWSEAPEVQAALLVDLAHLRRDRLHDMDAAVVAYEQVVSADPAHSEALDVLSEAYRKAHRYEDLFALYLHAAEARWDPAGRVSLARKAAETARIMGRADLATAAWERVWQLGEHAPEVEGELTRAYRNTKGWDALARFLENRLAEMDGPLGRVLAWETAELHMAVRKDAARTRAVIDALEGPQDPLAISFDVEASAVVGGWDHIGTLGQAAQEMPAAIAAELLTDAAAALRDGGQYKAALEACNQVRALGVGTERIEPIEEACLEAGGAPERLLEMLTRRADEAPDRPARIALLEKAARIAETELQDAARAVALWQRTVELDQTFARGHEALERYAREAGDDEGVARALEGQVLATREREGRIALLRRLGEHYAKVMGRDEEAERCWRQLLDLDPGDVETRAAFVDLHARRGDYEAINSALLRQIWLTDEPTLNHDLRRRAALNAEERLHDAARAVEAWQRVLDVAPTDLEAFDHAAAGAGSLERAREEAGLLEEALAVEPDPARWRERALALAAKQEERGQKTHALILFEEVLRRHPGDPAARDGAVRIWLERDQPGMAVVLLEHIAAQTDDPEAKGALLRRVLELAGPGRPRRRLAVLRQLLDVEGPTEALLDELTEAARASDGTAALYASLERELRRAQGEDAARLRERVMGLLLGEGGDAARAYALAQAPLIDATRDHDGEALEAMAVRAGRVEDFLAVLEGRLASLAQAGDAAGQSQVLAARARLAVDPLGDPQRALEEHRRRLELDPGDEAALAAMEALAREYGLWADLDDALGWLLARVDGAEARVAVHRRRHAVRKDGLNDPSDALDALLAILREEEVRDEVRDEALAVARQEGAVGRVLPLLAAVERGAGDGARADKLGDLGQLAASHEEKDAAMVLYAGELRQDASHEGAVAALEGLAEDIDGWGLAALALRVTAARERALHEEPARALALLRRVADIYEHRMGSHERAVEAHRAILDLDPGAMDSLEVMVGVHRDRGEWRDLRDRLEQMIERSDDVAANVHRWIEVASLSVDKLQDPGAGLDAFAAVLALDPEHAEAKEAIRKLREEAPTPETELRVLQAQWRAASPERAAELGLDAARLQEVTLGDPDGAIDTLFAVVERHGPQREVLGALAERLRARERWADLASVLEQLADAGPEEEREGPLTEAAAIVEEHLGSDHGEQAERLYRKLWALAPADPERVARLQRLLGREGRWEDLDEVLRAAVEAAANGERSAFLWERVRTLRQLGGDEELDRLLEGLAETGDHPGARAALAARARERGDVERYLALREAQTDQLPSDMAALVMCHLAEVCDETEGLDRKVIPYYRKARKLDRSNVPASEALKAYGRRIKALRPAAALLPEEGERALPWQERAAKLTARGEELLAERPAEALEWFRRAVAVDPHALSAWEALAQAHETMGEPDFALDAWLGALGAFEWTQPSDGEGLGRHAALLERAARAALAAESELAAELVARAHLLDPDRPEAALAAAELLAGEGDQAGAVVLLSRLLRRHETDSGGDAPLEGLEDILCQRAELLVALDRRAEALEDYRRALDIDPLSDRALETAIDILREAGRPVAAVRHALRWLLVLEDAEARGQAYAKLGRLLGTDVQQHAESLACVEMALQAGIVERDMVAGALEGYRALGDLASALRMTEVLVESTTEPEELASLWTIRGEVLAGMDATSEEAVEAFEMALSYDPDRQGALNGLAGVLEAREDWEALSTLLEPMARSADPKERASVMRRLASFALARGDSEEAAERLMEAVELDPSVEDLQRLEALFADDPTRLGERLKVSVELLAHGDTWAARLLGLIEGLVEFGDRRSAYALASLLLRVSRHSPEARELLHGLRRDFERGAGELEVSLDARDALRPSGLAPELGEVLQELEELMPELVLPADRYGRVLRIGDTMSHGKVAISVVEALAMEPRAAYRCDTLPAAFVPVSGDPPGVALRADVMQRLVHGAATFVTAWGLELTRPGLMLLSTRDTAEERADLVEGLFAAVGLAEATTDAGQALAARIREAVDDDTREGWNAALSELPGGGEPRALAERWFQGARSHAFQVAAALIGDMRQVARALSLVDPDVPQVKTLATATAFDELVAGSPALQRGIAEAARASVLLALHAAGI